MMWQLGVAALVGYLFYVRRFWKWLTGRGNSRRPLGFLFAFSFAAIAAVVVSLAFRDRPIPRLSEVFVVGVALDAYFFTWESAVSLLAAGLVIGAYHLASPIPGQSHSSADLYWLASYSLMSFLLVVSMARLKRRAGARSQPAELLPARVVEAGEVCLGAGGRQGEG